MGIIERAQGLLASNFNALISRFEEPGRDIALLLREMREQIRLAERELIRVLGERKRSEAKFGELESQVAEWEKRAELAVKQGDDALAREALTQRQRCILERDGFAVNRTEQQRAALAMKAEIERMRRTHQDYSARQNTIATEVTRSRAGGGVAGLGAKLGTASFDAFDRIANGIEDEEAVVAATAEIEQMMDQTATGKMTKAELELQFRRLERDAENPKVDGESAADEMQPVDGNDSKLPRIRIQS